MNIAIPDRYLLAADFEKRAVNCIFPAGVWNVAAALSEVGEAASPFELEKLTGLGSEQVEEALKRLLAKKLVRQNLISWKEFTTAKTAEGGIPHGAGTKAAPMAAMPPDKSAQPQAELPVESTARIGNVPTQEGVAARLGTIARQPTAAATTNAWVWQKPDPAQVAASKPVIPESLPNGEQPNGRLLRPMLAQIENIKGGGVEGQLLVYQVFLRVPYQLLHDEGIKSLHFVDERTVIQNPVLHAAIVKAAKDVTGVDLA